MNERLRNIVRHPLTHITLLGLTGLPLACARPAETYNIDGAITIPQATALAKMEPSRNASTNTTTVLEVQAGSIKAVEAWRSLFGRDLTSSAQTLRFDITQQFQVKGQPFTATDLIQGLVPVDQTILTVKSSLTDNSPASGYGTAGSGARRMLGITEIRGVRVEHKPQPLTLEQQANKVQQAGTTTIRFLARGAYSIWEGKDALGNRAIEQARTPSMPTLSPNIPWREQERTIDLATGKIGGYIDPSTKQRATINEALKTPVTIFLACPNEPTGYGWERTCLQTTT